MTATDFFIRVIAAFEKLQIPYVTVGSFAANMYMDVRSTKDADFVLEFDKINLNQLAAAIGEDFVLDPQMTIESVTMTTKYKLKHRQSVFEVELFSLSSDPHDQARYSRKMPKTVAGHTVYFLTAEDVVITKLRWAVRARRPKDQADVENVLGVQAGKLDYDYIRQWADQHGTRELFEKLYEEAKQFEV